MRHVLSLVLLLAGCAPEPTAPDAGTPETAAPDAAAPDAGPVLSEHCTPGPSSAPAPCAPVTILVQRLAYTDATPLGSYQLTLGESEVDAAEALVRAEQVVGEGYRLEAQDTGTSGPWRLFSASAGDWGVTSMVARDGTVLFAGETVWMGGGDILHPTAWTAPNPQEPCPTVATVDAARFALFSATSEEQPTPEELAGYALFRDPGLRRFEEACGTEGGLILLYARTEGRFDPMSAEWVVFAHN